MELPILTLKLELVGLIIKMKITGSTAKKELKMEIPDLKLEMDP